MANRKKEPGEKITTNGLGLPERLWPKLDRMANERKESRNALLRRIIEEAVETLDEYSPAWEAGKNDK